MNMFTTTVAKYVTIHKSLRVFSISYVNRRSVLANLADSIRIKVHVLALQVA